MGSATSSIQPGGRAAGDGGCRGAAGAPVKTTLGSGASGGAPREVPCDGFLRVTLPGREFMALRAVRASDIAALE